jgi:hypothetical protein
VPPDEVYGMSSEHDEVYWEKYNKILVENEHSQEHIISLWPVYARRITLVRFLAHYELFKKVIDLPGDIVDLGVSRGVSFFTFHKFLEIFLPSDTSRKIIGVDSFEGLNDFSENDGQLNSTVGKTVGGWSAGHVEGEVMDLLDLHNFDGILSKKRGIIVKGRVQEVLDRLIAERSGMRISILHLDLDLYEPTIFALRKLWDLVIPGGIIVFDEYALPPWEGETLAWEDFAKERGLQSYRIQKIQNTLTPNGFIVKL